MAKSEVTAACRQCGRPLNGPPSLPVAERMPCPDCGSMGRKFSVHIHATASAAVAVYRQLCRKVGRVMSGGRRRAGVELTEGDDYWVDGKEWVYLRRVVNRLQEPAWYSELLKRYSGEVIRHIEEPLKKHRGRGSAKFKKKT